MPLSESPMLENIKKGEHFEGFNYEWEQKHKNE